MPGLQNGQVSMGRWLLASQQPFRQPQQRHRARAVGVDGLLGTREPQPRIAFVGDTDYSSDDLLLAQFGTRRKHGSLTKEEQAEKLIWDLLDSGGGERVGRSGWA